VPISDDEEREDVALNERLMDLFVFVPAGIALSVVEDFPKLAARGREKLGTRVTSARAIGEFAVKAGADEFRRRSEGLLHRSATAPQGSTPAPATTAPTDPAPTEEPSEAPVTASSSVSVAVSSADSTAPAPPAPSAHIPAVGTLSIPGFDTLSASQVVQRLDGLNRTELVSVRAYESQTRGRRTILSRVDQLLDERS
jgi:hypothetical protein